MSASTKNIKLIRASQETLYRAMTDPRALEVWLAPGEMKGKVHNFDLKIGGGYEMSLFYPENDKTSKGKSASKEDRFKSTFAKLSPERIVQRINFLSEDKSFAGDMMMEISLEPEGDSTLVTFIFRDIPSGIKPEDNEEGTALTLEKLAKFVE
jgi:uncharacterized protein YndB with AHSA1/START domain